MTIEILEKTIEVIPDFDADYSYLEQDEFKDRYNEFKAGNFGFIGIRAKAEVVIDGVIQHIYSSGLWSIEDDSDSEYIEEVKKEEIEGLDDILRELRNEV